MVIITIPVTVRIVLMSAYFFATLFVILKEKIVINYIQIKILLFN